VSFKNVRQGGPFLLTRRVRVILDGVAYMHVARANLTMRTLLKRFTRLSLGFSKKFENLEAACAMYFAFYNYVWRSRHTDYSCQRGKLRPTPAMMAGLTDRLWSFEDLFDAVAG
jgi:hypothetical protein